MTQLAPLDLKPHYPNWRWLLATARLGFRDIASRIRGGFWAVLRAGGQDDVSSNKLPQITLDHAGLRPQHPQFRSAAIAASKGPKGISY